MDAALYDPAGGFYAAGGRAGGRAGQFLTSPEVGPLFGAVLARAVDAWWEEAGRPSPFVVVDAGAGPGTLARAVLAARPAVAVDGALRYVAVERAAAQRAAHAGLAVASAETVPDEPFTGVVVANELLDNLPFRLAVHDGGWREAFVDVDAAGRPVEVLVPFAEVPSLPAGPGGARGPSTRAGGGRALGPRRAGPPPAARAARGARLRVVDGGHGGAAVAGVAADLPRPPAGRALPRRSRDAGHHQRRGPRPAPAAHHDVDPGRLLAGARPRGARRRGAADVGGPRGGARPRRADRPQPGAGGRGADRPRPASVASPSPSG